MSRNPSGGTKWGTWETKTIISCLDDYKRQRQDTDTLDVTDILKRLGKILSEDRLDGQTIDFSVKSVDRHVYKLATKFGKEHGPRTKLGLLVHGSAVLDFNKFPTGIFSEAEIKANQDIDVSNLKDPADKPRAVHNTLLAPNMMRCLIEFVDENKGDNGLFMTDHHEATRQALARLRAQWPNGILQNITPEQIGRQIEHIATHWLHGTIPGGTPAEKNFLFIHGKSAIDYGCVGRTREGVFTKEEIASWKKDHSEEEAGKGKSHIPRKRRTPADELNWEYPARKSQRTVSIPDSDSLNQDAIANSVDSRNTSNPAEYDTGALSSLQQFLTNAPTPSTLKPEYIAKEVSSIGHSINATVFRRLRAADIDMNAPVTLSLDQLDHDFTKLLEKVLGFQRTEFAQGRAKLNELRAGNHLPLDQFIQSIIGAGLTTWALRPDPSADAPHKTLDIYRRVVRHMSKCRLCWVVNILLMCTDSNLAMHVDAMAREAYLDEEVVPKIKQKAVDLAERLDNVLFRFLAPPSSDIQPRKGHGFDGKYRIPTYGADSDDSDHEITVLGHGAAPAPSVSPITPPRHSQRSAGVPSRGDVQPHFTIEWIASLAKIFERALNLRVKMEKEAGRAAYIFEFPYPGQYYDESDREGHIGPVRKQRRVMVGILPAVYYVTKDKDGREVDRVACAPHKAFDC
jgi:hypothetical protein